MYSLKRWNKQPSKLKKIGRASCRERGWDRDVTGVQTCALPIFPSLLGCTTELANRPRGYGSAKLGCSGLLWPAAASVYSAWRDSNFKRTNMGLVGCTV